MTRRIIRRKPPPKVKIEKRYVCPACRGTLHAMRRAPLERVKEVHGESCPALRTHK